MCPPPPLEHSKRSEGDNCIVHIYIYIYDYDVITDDNLFLFIRANTYAGFRAITGNVREQNQKNIKTKFKQTPR